MLKLLYMMIVDAICTWLDRVGEQGRRPIVMRSAMHGNEEGTWCARDPLKT